MNANEPTTQWPPDGADHVAADQFADARVARASAPDRDLRVGHDDGLVHHSVPRGIEPIAGIGAGRRPRPIRKFLLLLLFAGIAWTAWAAAAFYDLAAGLHDADAVALERRIDWPSVRGALREDLSAGAVAPAGGRTVDALLSEQSIANLLRGARLDETGWDTAAPTDAEGPATFDWHRIRYAFFTGSPFAFRVDILPDSATQSRPVVLLFRWTGDWRLARVFLPSRDAGPALAARGAPASEPAATAAPAWTPAIAASTPFATPAPGAPPPGPAGAERATLYEEDPKDAQGKLYSGSAIWRTEQIQAASGGESNLVVYAQVNIPGRPLSATIAIRRNLDRALPASHTVDVSFELPANSPSKGVQDMVGIMMKPNEEAPGQNLAGTRVKVRDGFFLLGLSAIDLDVQHNMQILKDRAWFGIPFRYGNGNRAVLVIEKGSSGEKSLAEAFAQWGSAAAVRPGAGRN
jgi:hypothetical protein